jgi:hypothetical protein
VSGSSGTDVLSSIGWVDCNSNEAAARAVHKGLNRFQLDRSLGRAGYKFSCIKPLPLYVGTVYTENTTPLSSHGSNNTLNLAEHTVDCGEYPLTAFKYTTSGVNGQYIFKCAEKSTHTGECRDLDTGWNTGSHQVVYLDRHNVTCGENEVITKFKLSRDNGNFRYDYRCCKLEIPK